MQLLKGLVRIDVLANHRPVNEVQIEVVCPQLLQRFVYLRAYGRLTLEHRCVPDF